MPEPREIGLKCRCGLIVPRKQMIENGYLCPDCRLARILTEYDRPVPETMMDVVRDNYPNKKNPPLPVP